MVNLVNYKYSKSLSIKRLKVTFFINITVLLLTRYIYNKILKICEIVQYIILFIVTIRKFSGIINLIHIKECITNKLYLIILFEVYLLFTICKN